MRILAILLILGITGQLIAQNGYVVDSLPRNINFRVVDASTKEPLGLAHIINVNRQKGVTSDLLGYLNIPVAIGDSLNVSAIGYDTKTILSWGQYKSDTLFYEIFLVPRIYEIKEVKISRFSTYEKFLRDVINLKLPVSKEEEQLERLQQYFFRIVKGVDLMNLPGQTSGVAFGKDWYVKQKEKLADMMDREKDKRTIDRKYNPGLVKSLTGLEGDELYKFIGQFNLDNDFLLKASDYEIREKILERFKVYKEQKAKDEAKKVE